MTLHVIPRDDLVVHEAADECACQPVAVPTEGGFVMVHHAWDGRPR